MPAIYLDRLRAAAEAAERAEVEFRGYAENRLETMSGERVRAYCRYHLVRDMVESARPVAAQAACVAAQVGCVLAQAGWSESDAAYNEVREEFGRVAILVHRTIHGEPGTDPAAQVLPALRVFETWYRECFGAEFPAFLPRAPSSFQPLIDF